MGDGKGRPQAGSCPTQGGLMPVKDGAQPAIIFTAVPQRGGTIGAGGRGGRSPQGWAKGQPPHPALAHSIYLISHSRV